MAEPNISLMGATYSGVKGVTLPKSGGGTATFPWVEGSETKTANGTYDVTNLAQLIVNVAGGGGSGYAYETGTFEPAADISVPAISFAQTHTTGPIFVMMEDCSDRSTSTANSNTSFVFVDFYQFFGNGYPHSTSASRYGYVVFSYRTSSSTTIGTSAFSYSSNNTGESTTSYTRYWANSSRFQPNCGSSRYWRSGRIYKWVAVWNT